MDCRQRSASLKTVHDGIVGRLSSVLLTDACREEDKDLERAAVDGIVNSLELS